MRSKLRVSRRAFLLTAAAALAAKHARAFLSLAAPAPAFLTTDDGSAILTSDDGTELLFAG